MRKLIILYTIALTLCTTAGAQLEDTPYIIEQKQHLPGLTDSGRVFCLAKIAQAYIYSGTLWISDSGLHYARQGYELANKLNYKMGIAMTSRLIGSAMLQRSNPNEGLIYFRITAQTAREIHNDWFEATGIRGKGEALWFQGNFQQGIDTISLAAELFRKLKDNDEVSNAILTIASIYGNQGNYEKAFETAQQALTASKEANNIGNTIVSLVELGTLYKKIGDYEGALEYYKMGYSYNAKKGPWYHRYLSMSMGDLYCDLQRFDSAWYFYQESLIGNPTSKASMIRIGNYYLLRKNNDSAMYYFNRLYNELKDGGERHIYIYAILGMGKVWLAKKEYSRALLRAREALALAEQKNAKLNIRDAYELLYSIHDELQRPVLAYNFYKSYVHIKDSIITDQFKGKLYEFRRISEDQKKLTQIELLKKERQIAEQQLSGNRFLRNILFAGILLVGLLSVIIFWVISLKRKNEKLESDRIQTELQRRASELEMQALRAQMNPHFIFNCLSSINRFILKNEPDKASDYLTRFSRLIRLVLINSQRSLIILEEEITMLRLYIEMEQLRFKNSFDYSIIYTNDIEAGSILIPPLLLQPFCENSIWHGLMHKNGHGHLTISFQLNNGVLNCTISDDGVGRSKAAEIEAKDDKHKSVGLRLTAERLALFNEDNGVQTSYKIEDITDEFGNIAGTKVILDIRYKEFSEETV